MKPNILVVDDSEIVRHIVSQELKDYGFSVYEASNGLEGIELLRSKVIHGVISDVKMPVMDGYKFLEKIRKEFLYIKFVYFTNEPNVNLPSELKNQYSFWISKNESVSELTLKIVNLITQ